MKLRNLQPILWPEALGGLITWATLYIWVIIPDYAFSLHHPLAPFHSRSIILAFRSKIKKVFRRKFNRKISEFYLKSFRAKELKLFHIQINLCEEISRVDCG